MPELYIKAGAENDAEELEDRQAESDGAQDYQMVLRRLQELVNTALKRHTEKIVSNIKIKTDIFCFIHIYKQEIKFLFVYNIYETMIILFYI